jgi:hypothetical protein
MEAENGRCDATAPGRAQTQASHDPLHAAGVRAARRTVARAATAVGLAGSMPPSRRPVRPLGLFKVLIVSSEESERQRGLCGHRPARIGNVPIVRLTQERDGARVSRMIGAFPMRAGQWLRGWYWPSLYSVKG